MTKVSEVRIDSILLHKVVSVKVSNNYIELVSNNYLHLPKKSYMTITINKKDFIVFLHKQASTQKFHTYLFFYKKR